MPSHAHSQGYSDLNFMIPEIIGGIQYMKGPYYARVAYEFIKGWTLAVDVFNVFNAKVEDVEFYYASRLIGEPAEGGERYSYSSGKPARSSGSDDC